jgi:hypothetical protein
MIIRMRRRPGRLGMGIRIDRAAERCVFRRTGVTHVPAHLLPMSPLNTPSATAKSGLLNPIAFGEGLKRILHNFLGACAYYSWPHMQKETGGWCRRRSG